MSGTTGTWTGDNLHGHWKHDDGSPCPIFLAHTPTADVNGLSAQWWCTEHQQHLRWDPPGPMAESLSAREDQ